MKPPAARRALEVWITSEAQWGFSLIPTAECDWWVRRVEALGRAGHPPSKRVAQRLRGTRDLYRVVGPGGFVVLRSSGSRRMLVLAFVKRRPEEIVQATLELEGNIARARAKPR